MDLNKHGIGSSRDSILHSNGYARVSAGDRLGATDSTPFSQRQQVESNRRLVGSYEHSAIGSTHSELRPITITGRQSQPIARRNMPKPGRFNEPAGRTYNPYS